MCCTDATGRARCEPSRGVEPCSQSGEREDAATQVDARGRQHAVLPAAAQRRPGSGPQRHGRAHLPAVHNAAQTHPSVTSPHTRP